MLYVSIQPGFVGSLHYHVYSENTWIVLAGTLTIVVDGVSHELHENDLILIPRGAHHSAANYGEEVVEVVEIYSPPKAADDSHRVEAS